MIFHQCNEGNAQQTAGLRERSKRWCFHFSFANEKPQLLSGLPSDGLPAASDFLKWRQREADSCAQHGNCQTAAAPVVCLVASSQRETSMTRSDPKQLARIRGFKGNGGQGIWKHHRLYSVFLFKAWESWDFQEGAGWNGARKRAFHHAWYQMNFRERNKTVTFKSSQCHASSHLSFTWSSH